MLNNPVWASLAGPQACFAEAAGDAARYLPEISPFCALRDPGDPAGWRDLATLTDKALLTGPSITLTRFGRLSGRSPVPPQNRRGNWRMMPLLKKSAIWSM